MIGKILGDRVRPNSSEYDNIVRIGEGKIGRIYARSTRIRTDLESWPNTAVGSFGSGFSCGQGISCMLAVFADPAGILGASYSGKGESSTEGFLATGVGDSDTNCCRKGLSTPGRGQTSKLCLSKFFYGKQRQASKSLGQSNSCDQ